MTLIYSRPRIRIPLNFRCNNNPKKDKKKKLIIILIIFVLIISISIRIIIPLFNTLCSEKAKEKAMIIITETIGDEIKNYSYSDFINIHKDENGNVLMIESNMININKIISNVSRNIQFKLKNIEDENLKISLGSFTGAYILSGRGIKIPFKISTVGNLKTKIRSELKSEGINQTIHRLYLDIKCEISILSPFNTITEELESSMIIGENIIVGEVPETYYNLDGMTEDDTLNVIQ